MPLYWSLIIIAAIFTLMLHDHISAVRKLKSEIKGSADAKQHADIKLSIDAAYAMMHIAPLVTLFYRDVFWQSLLYLIPLYIYMCLLLAFTWKKAWLRVNSVGIISSVLFVLFVLFLSIFIHYLILFFQGNLRIDTNATWPYIVFIVLLMVYALLVIVERQNNKQAEASAGFLIFYALVFPFLPLFTAHYWWGLLGSSVILMIVTTLTMRRVPDVADDRGCMQGAVVIGNLFACIVSMVLHVYFFHESEPVNVDQTVILPIQP